jgi:hypothetical protein
VHGWLRKARTKRRPTTADAVAAVIFQIRAGNSFPLLRVQRPAVFLNR